MTRLKVLFVTYDHPSVQAGGAQQHALELYEAMRTTPENDPYLLSYYQLGIRRLPRGEMAVPFGRVNSDDPHQYFLFGKPPVLHHIHYTSHSKGLFIHHFRDFLLEHRPDIIHFQCLLFLGHELFRVTRNVLPNVPIIHTLHDYMAMCQTWTMLTTSGNLCNESSPSRCHRCYPQQSLNYFARRKRYIQSLFSSADLLIAPSKFLMQRYIAWGIPTQKLVYIPNGRPLNHASQPPQNSTLRTQFGFTGQLSAYKGVDVLLKAMKILGEEGVFRDTTDLVHMNSSFPVNDQHGNHNEHRGTHLWLHGANLDIQPPVFQKTVRALLEETRQNVTFAGRYRASDIPSLMANIGWVIVPSIWWENAPMVIQEAFSHGRPVICSDIGGMAEMVTDGVNGLHFRAGDPSSLAETIRRAVSTPGLWEHLQAGIPAIFSVEDQVGQLSSIYRELLDHRAVDAADLPGASPSEQALGHV
jgi:glycosyltransferase involved in cell wall biosynthesis